MTSTYAAAERRRRVFVPPPTGTVPRPPAPLQDPPIYRDLMRAWADGGRTLPGRHDPEWARLAAPQVRTGEFSGFQGPQGDGR
ncbi:hypothetical protein PO587_42810 [Streptomyces gilvifuscus]|uniref:DUF2934 domain-containing protein n=1 Tax=Streptomyces gilvifuscus TaxID=1550617 RepID=A0ABT5G8T3_9ACTN|nr:hypothetical protein [Streptomyces gilvifuscus]MDC2961174.1 hypothetical protein [Streptomyces gilvifuscus]